MTWAKNRALVATVRGPRGDTGEVSEAELAAAIATVNAALALKAALAGPQTHTGVHSFPTAAVGTNTQQAATTAYVIAEIINRIATKQPLDEILTALSAVSPIASGIVEFASGVASLLTRDTDTTLAANSDLRLPSQKAVKAYVDGLFAANDVMIFKGVIDCSGNPNYPAANRGDTYRVSVAGKIGGASGPNVEVGDTLICLTDGTASGNHATVGAQWGIIQVNIDGAVVGPASATDSHFAQFDGTTGKLIKGGKAAPSGVVVGTTDAQTLTNKTLTSPAISTPTGLVKGDVGLGNVDNTSDATKNSASATLTNKTVNLASNTLSGTTSQFNAALSDGDFATLAGSEALTNKTVNGVTLDNNAWTTYTPTLTASGGTPTTSFLGGRYKIIGKTGFLFLAYTISALNGASGDIGLSFPGGISPNANATNAPGNGLNVSTNGAVVVKISTVPNIQFIGGATAQAYSAFLVFEVA